MTLLLSNAECYRPAAPVRSACLMRRVALTKQPSWRGSFAFQTARLKLAHTNIWAVLLKDQHVPQVVGHQVSSTVRHILDECLDFGQGVLPRLVGLSHESLGSLCRPADEIGGEQAELLLPVYSDGRTDQGGGAGERQLCLP